MKPIPVFVPHATLATLGMTLQESAPSVAQPIVRVVLEALVLLVQMATDSMQLSV